jgi:hypothetical protein
MVEICSRRIRTLTNDANKYLEYLEKARKPDMSEKVKGLIGKFVGKALYVIDEPYIMSLIRAAKQVEVSLHIALSAMIFAKIEAK